MKNLQNANEFVTIVDSLKLANFEPHRQQKFFIEYVSVGFKESEMHNYLSGRRWESCKK